MQNQPEFYKLCPYFVADGAKEVSCRSHVADSSCVTIKFPSHSKKEVQEKCFCRGHYQSCEHYLSIKHFEWAEE